MGSRAAANSICCRPLWEWNVLSMWLILLAMCGANLSITCLFEWGIVVSSSLVAAIVSKRSPRDWIDITLHFSLLCLAFTSFLRRCSCGPLFAMETTHLHCPPRNIDDKYVLYDLLLKVGVHALGFDEQVLCHYFHPIYIANRPLEEKPPDFLIPFDDYVCVVQLHVDPSDVCRAAMSDNFKYMGTSRDGFYLLLCDRYGLKFAYPKFFSTDTDPPRFRHFVCSIWRNRNYRCACLVLKNRHLAYSSSRCTCAVIGPCALCNHASSTGSKSEAATPATIAAEDNESKSL